MRPHLATFELSVLETLAQFSSLQADYHAGHSPVTPAHLFSTDFSRDLASFTGWGTVTRAFSFFLVACDGV